MVIKLGQAGYNYRKQAVTNFKRNRKDLKRKQIDSSHSLLLLPPLSPSRQPNIKKWEEKS